MANRAEEYFASLLWELRILTDLTDWVRSHAALFGQCLDLEQFCACFSDTGEFSKTIRRSASLSGMESDTASPEDCLYSLRSVFSRLSVGTSAAAQPVYIPSQHLSQKNFFPTQTQEPLSPSVLKGLDNSLFVAEQNPPKDSRTLAILLDTLLKRHLCGVPAGYGKEVDISLYDKMKTTAAVFSCLTYANVEKETPFLLLASDFSGIQNYIFSVARTNVKGVAKRLRARSFLVDVMVQTLSYQICDRLDIPYNNILMCTGGKFYLLLPNTPEVQAQLRQFQKEMEEYLFHRFYGDIAVNMAWVTFGAEGLTDYSATVTELSRRLREQKQQAFQSVLKGADGWREESFILTHQLAGKRSCPSCGRRLMDSSAEVCPECRGQEEMGGKLTGARFLWLSREGGEYQLWPECWLSFSHAQAQGELIRVELLNNWDIPSDMTHLPLGVRLIANHLPKDQSGEPLTFSDIGALASGSKRLAVLKADVDNLGYLFADGMREGTRHYGTISRVSTMSRLLELFFSGYVGALLETKYTQVYSVFSGGDDLFLIGPWDIMPEMALFIQKEFRRFTGENLCVTLSAAVFTADPKTNIALLAEQSEAELKRVKNSAPVSLYPSKAGRDGVSFLGDIFSWKDLEAQLCNADALRKEVGAVNVSILRRIMEYSEMYRRFLIDHDVLGLMFEPLLHYDRTRNYDKLSKDRVCFFLRYAVGLSKNAADYRRVNRDLYFAKTVMTFILNQTKEARKNGV